MRSPVLVGLAAALLISVTLNAFLFTRIRSLEDRLWLTSIRFSDFIDTMARVVKRAHFTVADLDAAQVLGAPPKEGKGYVEHYDPHYGFGIRYTLDDKGRVVGWEEIPKMPFFTTDEKGNRVIRSPHEFANQDDKLVIPR
jgi:hypothetical protein